MATETKKEMSTYCITLPDAMTPQQYLSSRDGASILNDSVIYFLRDSEGIEEKKIIRDIWIRDSDGNDHLMSGWSRFFHLDDDLKKEELANTNGNIGLLSPEVLSNINALLAVSDLDTAVSKLAELESKINDLNSAINNINAQIKTLQSNINKQVLDAMLSQKDILIAEIKNELKDSIDGLLDGFINHAH